MSLIRPVMSSAYWSGSPIRGPVCGSTTRALGRAACLLIESRRYVEDNGGDPNNLRLYGQEENGGTWAISRMNLLLHGATSSS